MPNRIRQQLLDICVLRLRANLEPAAERRAQIASALGSLYYARVIDELYQLLARRIRPTPDGMRYDLSNVRLAAARALRIQLTRAGLVTDSEERPEPYTEAQWPALPAEDPAQAAAAEGEAAPLMNQIAPDLQALFRAWVAGADGRLSAQERVRAELRAAITREESTLLQQVVAAFALGDLAYHVEDAELLLHMMLRPSPAPMAEHQHEWSEVIWAAAEALALFDAELVSALLVRFFDEGKHTSIPEHSIEQMIHVIGRVRVQDERILRWLHDVLMDAPNHYVKGRALQSLAWLGKAQQSREWLHRLVQSLKWLKEEDPVTPLIEQVMQAIAAWDMRILSMLEEKGVGQFQLADEPDEEQEKATLYLRLKAVEALALVGNARTLERLYPLVPTWPLLLRGTWYLSSRTIRMRYNIPL
jgi:hypothetical protein